MINSKVNKNSDIVREIISKPPHEIIQWGSSIIALIYISISILCFNIYYPETLESKIMITTENPPICITAQNDCIINKLCQTNGSHINKGDTIAIIKHIKTREYLRSPIDGKIVYGIVWANNQQTRKGDKLFYIIPKNNINKPYIGLIKIPSSNYKQISIGQKVNIYLEEYPYTEFGILIGTITSVNNIQENGFYNIIINTPRVTDLNREIIIDGFIYGKAKIFTKETSIGKKFLSSFFFTK